MNWKYFLILYFVNFQSLIFSFYFFGYYFLFEMIYVIIIFYFIFIYFFNQIRSLFFTIRIFRFINGISQTYEVERYHFSQLIHCYHLEQHEHD